MSLAQSPPASVVVSAAPKRRWWHAAALALLVGWIIFQIASGLAYELKPAAVESAASGWPAGTALSLGTRGALVLFLHPHCPCSRATVSQLDRLLTAAQADDMKVEIVFVGPDADSSTVLSRAVAKLSGVERQSDVAGDLARRFGARISGEAFAYDGAGRLVFHGGLTSARGHEGDSYALTALIQWLRDGALPATSDTNEFPTFGCRL